MTRIITEDVAMVKLLLFYRYKGLNSHQRSYSQSLYEYKSFRNAEDAENQTQINHASVHIRAAFLCLDLHMGNISSSASVEPKKQDPCSLSMESAVHTNDTASLAFSPEC